MPPLLPLFGVGVALNLIWEVAHHQLYETCRRQTWRENVPLLITMSLKDGAFIVLFFLITAGLFHTTNILAVPLATALFLGLALSFSYLDEKISLRRKRWEYANTMPTIGGVGVTPLLELAVTGLIAIWLVTP